MSKLTCIIIEDEPLAAKVLQDYVAEVPFLSLKGWFKDAILASDFLRENQIDLIFLDIHLPKLKGMAFLKTLNQAPSVIITTAYQQYAVEGFDMSVTDYLLKPVEFERFLAAVTKVEAKNKHVTANSQDEGKDYLFVSVQKKKVKISFPDILYLESQREYVKIVTKGKQYLTKMSTHEIEALLPQQMFRRIHRSFIVCLSQIDSYTMEEVEINGIVIPVGKDYKNVLNEL